MLDKEDLSLAIDPFDNGTIWDKEEEEMLPKATTLEPSTPIELPSVLIIDVSSPFSGLLEEDCDSRSNPFKGGEDDVIMKTMQYIFYHVTIEEEDAHFNVIMIQEFNSKNSQISFMLTSQPMFSILALPSAVKFRWRLMRACWKAILIGYKFRVQQNCQIISEDA